MAEYAADGTNWSRRYKANLERLSSREYAQVAEVVRGLNVVERARGLSAGERRMLRRAHQLLKELPGEGGEAGVREPRRPSPPSGTDHAAIMDDGQRRG